MQDLGLWLTDTPRSVIRVSEGRQTSSQTTRLSLVEMLTTSQGTLLLNRWVINCTDSLSGIGEVFWKILEEQGFDKVSKFVPFLLAYYGWPSASHYIHSRLDGYICQMNSIHFSEMASSPKFASSLPWQMGTFRPHCKRASVYGFWGVSTLILHARLFYPCSTNTPDSTNQAPNLLIRC